jgi:hypothetical protein
MHIKNILEEGELTVNPIGFDKSTGCFAAALPVCLTARKYPFEKIVAHINYFL